MPRLISTLLLSVGMALICTASFSVSAATPAGTMINNQASASYRDSSGVLRNTTSNLVQTLIQQVAAVELSQSQTRQAIAGSTVYFPHMLKNTGNGPDSFALAVTHVTGDDFDATDIAIYADSDQNGLPDSVDALSLSPELDMLQQWNFVVAASIPPGTGAGLASGLNVQAQSQLNPALSQANIDTLGTSTEAVVELTKSISATSGLSPSGAYTVTLSYSNTGAATATDVTLIDALPVGMSYVAGSGQWSGAIATVLTDSDPNDSHGSGGPTLRFCAYHASCSGLVEAGANTGSGSASQITAIVSSLAPGEVGQLSFDVTIDAGLDARLLANTAEFEFTSASPLTREFSNTVSFSVLHRADVVVNGSDTVATDLVGEPQSLASAPQARAVLFDHYVWNTGNDTDSYDITLDSVGSTFPAGTLFRLLQSDGLTPLLDSGGNGLPDTGPLAVGDVYKVVLQAMLPVDSVGDNAGAGYQIVALATSAFDSTRSNSMVSTLMSISAATIDISNIAQVASSNSLGDGAGAETDPVVTVAAQAGGNATIDLYISNTGTTPVSLDLAASTTSDFSTIALPPGWTITYRLAGDATQVTDTGLIDAGQHVLVHADIALPAAQPAGEVSLYFRALAKVSGALDIIHDSVNVSAAEQLLLESDQSGQTDRGGSSVYHHLLTGLGNVVINNVALGTVDSGAAAGWSSVVYADSDGDGALSGADLPVTSLTSLAPGEVVALFVKVFAPANAELRSANNTVLSASWNAAANSVSVTDVTRVTESELSIVKEQAPDLGCDGVLDGVYGFDSFAVQPGNNCVSYRLTARNDGTTTVYNVDIGDATPAFTSYSGTANCAHASCAVAEPASGAQGNIVATLPSLAAGAAVVLTFSVRIE